MNKTGILLVNLGTPKAPTAKAIRAYLAEFLADPRVVELPRLLWLPILYGLVLTLRPRKLVKQYESIWLKEGSPLLVYSKNLADKLQLHLGDEYQVELAMSYGEPSIKNALEKLRNCTSLTVLPLYPQYSSTTSATVFAAVNKVLQSWRHIPSLKFIADYHGNENYLNAITKSIQTYWQEHGKPDKLIFSFHGLPKRNIDLGDPYQAQCEATANQIAQRLNLSAEQWILTYQSRFGRAKWLEPYNNQTLIALGKKGLTRVDVICPGFAVDCLETLEEINKTNKDLFLQAGGKEFHYIPALNDTNEHLVVLENILFNNSTCTRMLSSKQR